MSSHTNQSYECQVCGYSSFYYAEEFQDGYKGDRRRICADCGYTEQPLATPRYQPGDKVTTHECNGVNEVISVDTIAEPYKHGVTSDYCPSEVWYNLRRPDGTRTIISECHLRRAR